MPNWELIPDAALFSETSETRPNCELRPEYPVSEMSEMRPNCELSPEFQPELSIPEGSENGSRMLLFALRIDEGSEISPKKLVAELEKSRLTGSETGTNIEEVLLPMPLIELGSETRSMTLEETERGSETAGAKLDDATTDDGSETSGANELDSIFCSGSTTVL